MVYVCDPVLGDNDKFYVPQELIPLYQKDILPKAHIITPNQFEAEKLSEQEIKSEEDALTVLDKLHAMGPPIVVITSTFLREDENLIQLYASNKIENIRLRIDIPRVGAPGQHFTGTGDVLCAMILTHIERNEAKDFAKAIEAAANVLRAVLLKSIERPLMGHTELSLIAAKSGIEDPPMELKAEIIQ